MMAALSARPTHETVAAWVDALDRAEPSQGKHIWRRAYDGLHAALLGARKVRRYCNIPAAIIAALIVILLHGEAWDFDDVHNLFAVEVIAIAALHFALTKIFAVLAQEDRVQTLLRYYGAQDVPPEHEALQ